MNLCISEVFISIVELPDLRTPVDVPWCAREVPWCMDSGFCAVDDGRVSTDDTAQYVNCVPWTFVDKSRTWRHLW